MGVTLLFVAIAGVAFYWGSQQKGPSAQTQITATQIPTQTQTVTTIPPTNTPITLTPSQTKEFVNPSVTISNIEDSVKSKNYAALEGYMTPTVSVGIESSGCCGMLSAADATGKLSYLDKGTDPWDFSDTNPIAKQLAEKNPDHYKGYYIGTSANRMVAAFHLNDKYIIDKIFMSVDYKLTLP